MEAAQDDATTQAPPEEAPGLTVFIVFLFFFSFWNSACSMFMIPAWKFIFEGDIIKGIMMGMIMCLIPHVALGLWLPYSIFGFPICLIFYWPHFMAAYRVRKRIHQMRALGLDTRGSIFSQEMSDSLSFSQATVKRTGKGSRFPEQFELAKEKVTRDSTECSICFDKLCTSTVCVLMEGNERVCNHYFHLDCMDVLCGSGRAFSASCPLCRKAFTEAREFPQISPNPMDDNREWFDLASGGKEMLEKTDLEEALCAVLPFSPGAVRAITAEVMMGSDSISYWEFQATVPMFVISAMGQPPSLAAASAAAPLDNADKAVEAV